MLSLRSPKPKQSPCHAEHLARRLLHKAFRTYLYYAKADDPIRTVDKGRMKSRRSDGLCYGLELHKSGRAAIQACKPSAHVLGLPKMARSARNSGARVQTLLFPRTSGHAHVSKHARCLCWHISRTSMQTNREAVQGYPRKLSKRQQLQDEACVRTTCV